MTVLLLAGCGGGNVNSYTQKLAGNWANTYDENVVDVVFRRNATAVYEGRECTFTADEQYITLTGDDGRETRLRYAFEGKTLYLYKEAKYSCTDHDGIVGLWTGDNGKWSYEFTENGTFKEDGYFPGYYTVDESAGTFKLIYNDHFEDTVCYFTIDGDVLTVDYPWPMVKVK